MTYQDMSTVYRDTPTRQRAEMCIREQGMIFSNDTRPEIKALGQGCVAGNWGDIDAIWAAVSTGPSNAGLDDDTVMLSAVQGVWPSVAAARYPFAEANADSVRRYEQALVEREKMGEAPRLTPNPAIPQPRDTEPYPTKTGMVVHYEAPNIPPAPGSGE